MFENAFEQEFLYKFVAKNFELYGYIIFPCILFYYKRLL